MGENVETSKRVFSIPAIVLACAAFGFSALVLYFEVGVWESVRQAVVGFIFAGTWIASARLILGDTPIPASKNVKRPFLEAILMLTALGVLILFATLGYLEIIDLPLFVYFAIPVGLVVLIQLVFGYGLDSLGIKKPVRREWKAFLAIVFINVMFGLVYSQLPAGEAPTPAGADLADELTGPLSVVILIGSIFLGAALPEELVLRVGLQPKLAAIFGIGLAIVLQSLLFAFGHLPQQMLRYERPPIVALAYLLPIENGLIAGYIWYRTKNLPIILLIHVFAFPRFGR